MKDWALGTAMRTVGTVMVGLVLQLTFWDAVVAAFGIALIAEGTVRVDPDWRWAKRFGRGLREPSPIPPSEPPRREGS